MTAPADSRKPRPASVAPNEASGNRPIRLMEGAVPMPTVQQPERHLTVVKPQPPVHVPPKRVNVEQLAAAINNVLAGQPLADDTDLFTAVAAVAYATGRDDERKEVA